MVDGPVRNLVGANSREGKGDGGNGGWSGGSFGRVKYILEVVPVTGEGVTDGAEGTQHNSLGRSFSLSIVHLTGVRPEAPQGDQADGQGAVPQLLKALRAEWQHVLAAPPRDGGARPAHRAAEEHLAAPEGGHWRRGVPRDNSSFPRLGIWHALQVNECHCYKACKAPLTQLLHTMLGARLLGFISDHQD